MFPNILLNDHYAHNFKPAMPQATPNMFPANLIHLQQLAQQQQQQQQNINTKQTHNESKKLKKSPLESTPSSATPSFSPELVNMLNLNIQKASLNETDQLLHKSKTQSGMNTIAGQPANSPNSSVLNNYFNNYLLAFLSQASMSQPQMFNNSALSEFLPMNPLASNQPMSNFEKVTNISS
jgi:hypothetical protein